MADNGVLRIVTDSAAEAAAGVSVQGVTAVIEGRKEVVVLGEVVPTAGKPARSPIELHVVVYDSAGNVIARDTEYMATVGARRSFEITCALRKRGADPVAVRIYPVPED